jgi:hypothetical protein
LALWDAAAMPNWLKALLGGLVSLALMLPGVDLAAAETYTVTRTDDPNPAPCEAGDCSLRGALMASNGSSAVDDVVVLPASAAPYLLQYEFLTFQINDEVEVRGAGAGQTVVEGDGEETIFFVGSTKATLSGLTITGGQAAIQNNGELFVRGVSIEGNKWNGGTAGIISNGALTVESSFLGFNRTESASGGVIHTNAPLTIVNSTIARNTSTQGPGAISANFGVPVTIVNSAVVANRSEIAPAAAVGGAPLTLRNSVFADNRDAAGLFNCVSSAPVNSLGGNVSDDATCGGGATDKPNVDPGLGPLELHGAATQLYSLLAGSPAIDAASECPPVDQRGVARPQGAACDSGPYELVSPRLPPAPDVAVWLRLEKGKLILSRKGVVRVGLTCLPIETSPPCMGKVRLKVRPKVEFGGRAKRLLPLSSARFSIPAGKTKKVALKLPPKKAELVRSDLQARKVLAVVRAQDSAGNSQLIERSRKLRPRQR